MDTSGKAAQAAENWAMGKGRGKGGRLMDGFRFMLILDDGLCGQVKVKAVRSTAGAPAWIPDQVRDDVPGRARFDLSNRIGRQPTHHVRHQLSKQ
jgi:hypothetical protein